MTSIKQHRKVLLSGNDECGVLFCSECNVLELNLGTLTLRLHPDSLQTLGLTLNHAAAKLARMQKMAALDRTHGSGEIH